MSAAKAYCAVRVAKSIVRKWGAFAATRYAEKLPVPYPELVAACRFEQRRAYRAKYNAKAVAA